MLREYVEKAEKCAKKYTDNYEIYIEEEEDLEISLENSDLSLVKENLTRGLGIRIIKDDKLGFAYTSDMNKIDETVENAYNNAKLNEKDPNFSFSYETKLPTVKNLVDTNYNSLELDEITSFMNEIVNKVKDNDCSPTSGEFSKGYGKEILVNSNGVDVEDEKTIFGAYIAVNANVDETSSAYDFINSCKYDFTPDDIVNNACNIAKSSINGVNIDTSDKDVVLDYSATNGLLNTFINGFYGDNAIRGRSVIKDKVNEKIVSDKLSIYDDSTYNGGLQSCKFDDEGTASQKTTLIKNGVLKGFIYDIYNSNKAKCESTGNGFRGSYLGTPQVSCSNINVDFNEKVEFNDINDGIFATSLLGAHTANPLTGDFSVEVSNGFIVENGEKTKPIKSAMISGNVYDILKNCDGLNSEIKQYGHFITPQLLIHDLRVIGA